MHTRRNFLGAAAAAPALIAAATTESAGAAAAAPYDFAAVERVLALPFRHRQAFGAYRIAANNTGGFMVNALNAYQFDYGEGAGTLHVLGIYYGISVALALDDDAWRRYRLDVVQQRRGDPTPAGGDGNPYLHATSSLDVRDQRADLHGFYHDSSLAALRARGASFLACNNALANLATDVAVTYGLASEPPSAVLNDFHKHLVPGTLLVPAGVAAVNQAQEMKFAFMQTSL